MNNESVYEVLHKILSTKFDKDKIEELGYFYKKDDKSNEVLIYKNEKDRNARRRSPPSLLFFMAIEFGEENSIIRISDDTSKIVFYDDCISFNMDDVPENKEEYFQFQLINEIKYSYEELKKIHNLLKEFNYIFDMVFYPDDYKL